jgi:hypothetical protein
MCMVIPRYRCGAGDDARRKRPRRCHLGGAGVGEARGGLVVRMPVEAGYSTSRIIDKARGTM